MDAINVKTLTAFL